MEICDLDVLDFIQYRPEEVFGKEESAFIITTIQRDKQWFEKHLPTMTLFLQVLHGFLDNPEALQMLDHDSYASTTLAAALGMKIETRDGLYITPNPQYVQHLQRQESFFEMECFAESEEENLDKEIFVHYPTYCNTIKFK